MKLHHPHQAPCWARFARGLVLLLCTLWGAAPLWAQPVDWPAPPGHTAATAATATSSSALPAEPAELQLNGRKILTFRATLLGDTPLERLALAQAALAAPLAAQTAPQATRTPLGPSVRFDVNGQPMFYLVAADLALPRADSVLDAASADVLQRLQTALNESVEARSPRHLLIGAAYALLATAAAYGLLRLVLAGRRRVLGRLYAHVQRLHGEGSTAHDPARNLMSAYASHLRNGARWLTQGLTWLLLLLLADGWATYVLHQFALTRPWAERSTAWLLSLLHSFSQAIAAAVPGLLTAALIFVLARGASRLVAVFLDRVAEGQTTVTWLDRDTAVPTRRLVTVGIWLFAVAMAYPYLPGSGSEAFKGVSVLAGVMLSLGASSVVGQALSGFSLMYSRSLRVGEYVKLGDTEGTVTHLGLFTTKVHTGLGEEVSLPNTVVFGQPIRNFSRLVADGQFVLHTAVTIGYATPWRQVHAMLLEAARRTPGVAHEPPPYVVQTALSDFYVEYRLCCQSNRLGPQRRAEAMSALHTHIQDVFNENGVQIMSPHYMADPPEPQVVPPGSPWAR